MKIKMIVGLAALGLSASVAAQSGRSVFFVVSGMMTYGGDQLQISSTTAGVRAGGLYQFGAGLLWQPPRQPISVQATVNSHIVRERTSQSSDDFERMPIELLTFVRGAPNWRFGGGVRWVLNPKATSKTNGLPDQTVEFKDALGGVIEVGYRVGKASWLNARYVIEDYQAERMKVGSTTYSATGTTNGSHFGLGFTLGF